MNIRKAIYTPSMLLILLGTTASAYAQRDTLQQEVEVVKAYTPASIDAEKINENPVIKDEVHKKPNFSYSINSSPLFSDPSAKDLEAATIVGNPGEEAGLGLVRAGIGNYFKPYGELYFNNKENKNDIFGLHLKHLSSHGRLTLPGGDRVKAPFSENEAEIFLKHMFRSSVLSLNLGVDHNGFRYYGYPGTEKGDSIPSFLKTPGQLTTYQGMKQSFTRGGIQINLQNLYAGKDDPSNGMDFQYYRFGNSNHYSPLTRKAERQTEDYVKFEMNLKRPRDQFSFLVGAGMEYSGTNDIYSPLQEIDNVLDISDFGEFLTRRKQTWIFFKPAVYLGNETLNLKAGFKSWIVTGSVDKAAFKIAPDIRFNFVPVPELLNLFAGIDGNYFHNHYSAIVYQNPFLTPDISVKNHLEKYRFFGGFDGKISSKTNFKIQVDHSTFTGHPFFYLQGFRLPTMGPTPGQAFADNTFKVLYNDLKTTKFNGEITYYAGDKLNMLLTANIYDNKIQGKSENLQEEEINKPWNMPTFDATLAMNYEVTDRLHVALDFYVTGKREGMMAQLEIAANPLINWEVIETLTVETPAKVSIRKYTLDTAIDLNVRGSYDITGKLSAFIQLNNFGFQNYQRWLGYPVQSLNLLGGISYSF